MATSYAVPSEPFAHCISSSKRVRWDIETGVIRGHRFDHSQKFLPDGLTLVGGSIFLSPDERIYLSQTQGRTESIREDADLSELYKDVFLFHWKEECQQAIMDELEWRRIDAGISPAARNMTVGELIQLVGAVDPIVQAQAAADPQSFCRASPRSA